MLLFCRVCLRFVQKFDADCFGRQILGDSITFLLKPRTKSFAITSGCIEELMVVIGGLGDAAMLLFLLVFARKMLPIAPAGEFCGDLMTFC